MKKLCGKVAVITGGSSGIGLSIAKLFKQHGASVVIFGRNKEKLKTAIEILGDGILAIQGDVRNIDNISELFTRTQERFGRVDVLVANAGVLKGCSFDQVDEAHYNEMCDINFRGVFFTVQKSLPLLTSGSSIILVSSIANVKGYNGLSLYNATKAAVRSLARTLASELSSKGIRANSISPGFTDTPLVDMSEISNEQKIKAEEALRETIPLQRRALPEEIASVAVYLASQDSSYITGSNIVADGGVTQI